MGNLYNVNVGVLGHVDSGKTSLGKCAAAWRHSRDFHRPALAAWLHPPWTYPTCALPAVAALSTTLSTAALDKHPQSRERGITLDLGFSSFTVRSGGSGSVCCTACSCSAETP